MNLETKVLEIAFLNLRHSMEGMVLGMSLGKP